MSTSPLPPEPASPADLDSCKDLDLNSLSEPSGNQLRLELVEEVAHGPLLDVEISEGRSIRDARAVGPAPGCRIFEVLWPSYVAYSVLNESYTCRTDEEFVGRKLRVYSRSYYREFVARATSAHDDFPGPLKHWRVSCQDHAVDVVSTDEPVITLIGRVTSDPEA